MIGHIARILPFSSVDGPGNRSVVFLQGCNFNCLYCHNPETIPMPGTDSALHIQEMTVSEVIEELDKVKVFTSGVTISGGECTVQYEFLLALVQALKENDYNVFIDTNGNLSEVRLKALLPYTDGFMIDLKAVDASDHMMLTGTGNTSTLRSIHATAEAGKLYEVRTVVVPGLMDNTATVRLGAELIVEYDRNIRYKLIKYRSHGVRGELIDARQPTSQEMEGLKALAEDIGCANVLII